MARESFESALDRLLRQDKSSRRQFVGRAGSAALAGSALSAFLAACGGAEGTAEREGTRTTPQAVNHPDDNFKRVVFSNWPLYIDKDVIKDFEKEFSVEMRYTEDVNDNNDFFGKVRQPLEQGDGIGRDLVALTDWMAARWIRLGYVEPLDKKNIPNWKNLQDGLVNVSWDKGRANSLPWQSGMTGIGFNRKEVGDVKSLKQFFDPQYKGKVTALTEARDTLGLIMWMQGKKPSEASIDDVLAANEYLDEQNRGGQIRKFTGNEYTTDLAKGNVVMALAWSGDMVQLKADNPDLDFVIPEEGGMLWSDNMMIPQKPRTAFGAETWMNYVYEPEVAAKIAEYVNYVTPVKGTEEFVPQELASNTLVYPDAATRERLSEHTPLDVEQETQMNEAFQATTGA
jgi:spermidine/putrescine transport system substrate-binding protein